MSSAVLQPTTSADVLEHNLEPYFKELARFDSTLEMKRSELWRRIEPQVEAVLNAVVTENFAYKSEPLTGEKQSVVKAIAWNIERGRQLAGILDALHNHSDLQNKDLYLLTELDYGMARSDNLFVAREIAQSLELNYAFAPCYIALNKGSGVEAFVPGENTRAIHGLALFSRFPLRNAHSIVIPNGKDKMFGKEKRLGSLRAVIADVEHSAGTFRAVVVHLDAHSSRAHRVLQMKTVLDHLDALRPQLPVVFAGDWNTTTHNSQNAPRAILGYWRRILMGIKNVAANHYPHPDRFFERELFLELARHDFTYREFNELGAGTLHYNINSVAENVNLGDWVPGWCFPFIRVAANRVGGGVSLKLDWFTGRGIKPAPDSTPKVVGNLRTANGTPLSDHDAIVLDFTLQ